MHRMSIQENILDKYSGPLTHDDRGYPLAPSSGQSRGLGKLGRQGAICWIQKSLLETWSERIYNPITAMGFSAMFTFQLDNNKR